jgi:anti-repressor protein
MSTITTLATQHETEDMNDMKNMQIFSNPEFGSIRTVAIDKEPYFVGKDVAEILGYSKTRNAIAMHVDEEDKKDALIQGPLGGSQSMIVINESGLYSLILSSKLPSAKRFKRWVTSDVLPAIRRHGMYATDELLENPDLMIRVLQEYKAEREQRLKAEAERQRLARETASQKQQIEEMEPKASYYDTVLSSSSLTSITTIAKDYGWSAIRMNTYLHGKGVQYKQGEGNWLLYQKYADCGYAGSKTFTCMTEDGTVHTKAHTYWTQKGRLFIYELMKADGILPLAEREDVNTAAMNTAVADVDACVDAEDKTLNESFTVNGTYCE